MNVYIILNIMKVGIGDINRWGLGFQYALNG